MSVDISLFGHTQKGEEVLKCTLKNKSGGQVVVLNYGCILQSIIPGIDGLEPRDIVMGFDTIAGYEQAGGFIGATIGRCANRIVGGKFFLNNHIYSLFCNEGKNHLHGGKEGFNKKIWTFSENGRADQIRLSLFSPDGEEGYPGNLWIHVTLTFTDSNELIFETDAFSDKDTVFNLTNHSYFDLNGCFTEESAMSQSLKLGAEYFTPVDKDGIITGEITKVFKTPFDFSQSKSLQSLMDPKNEQIVAVGGYDHNYILPKQKGPQAVLKSTKDNLYMELHTTCPGMQLYSGNYLRQSVGKNQNTYGKRSGICLEPQFFPNSINILNFPSPILKANTTFHSVTSYKFGIKT